MLCMHQHKSAYAKALNSVCTRSAAVPIPSPNSESTCHTKGRHSFPFICTCSWIAASPQQSTRSERNICTCTPPPIITWRRRQRRRRHEWRRSASNVSVCSRSRTAFRGGLKTWVISLKQLGWNCFSFLAWWMHDAGGRTISSMCFIYIYDMLPPSPIVSIASTAAVDFAHESQHNIYLNTLNAPLATEKRPIMMYNVPFYANIEPQGCESSTLHKRKLSRLNRLLQGGAFSALAGSLSRRIIQLVWFATCGKRGVISRIGRVCQPTCGMHVMRRRDSVGGKSRSSSSATNAMPPSDTRTIPHRRIGSKRACKRKHIHTCTSYIDIYYTYR